MEAAEARRIAEARKLTDWDAAIGGLDDIRGRISAAVRAVAETGGFALEFDISSSRLSPGKEALLVIELRGKGYSVHPRSFVGLGTVLDIAW